jgi:hypothetical protein
MEAAKSEYAGKRSLQYQWELIGGPQDKIELQNPTELKLRIILGNLGQPEQFTLRLKAMDGLTEATDEVTVRAFPAQLRPVALFGGAWIGVTHMGDKWVAARGRQLEVFGPDWSNLASISLDFPIRQFFTVVDSAGQGALYVQDPQGNWMVATSSAPPGGATEVGPAPAARITRLPMLGRKISHFIPIQLEGQPYGFALLEKGVELWDFSDPRSPKLRKTLTTQLQSPHYLAFHGRHLYLADEQSIEIMDFSTGQALASVPSGGSITGLASYDVDGKGYLLVAVGRDRTGQGRQDYGLRLFEIDSGGRLGQEKRVPIDPAAAASPGQAGRPVERVLVIPGVRRALLAVSGEKGLELKIFDLAGQKLLPLNFSTPPDFVAIDEMATGKVGEQPVAAIADGNQLRVFGFQGDGANYSAAPLRSFPGILSAAWVLSDTKGGTLWIGDEGTASGGSLSLAQGAELKVSDAFNAGGAFPVAAAVATGADKAALLYLSSDPQTLPAESAQGGLGFLALAGAQGPLRSKDFLGLKNPQGELRPLGIAVQRGEAETVIAVAISRVMGAIGGSGIALLTQGKDQADGAFLGQDLKALQQIIPLQDARDVVLSPDGKAAYLAAGDEGVIAVDLIKKQPVGRMSLGKPWVADRILLSHGGTLALVSFIDPGTRNAIVKIFGVTQTLIPGKETNKEEKPSVASKDAKNSVKISATPAPVGQTIEMQEYGTLTGLRAVTALEGLRVPRLALTEDDLYLFAPLAGTNLTVFNLSNPAQPLKVAELAQPDEVRAVAVANRFKDIFVALGPTGVAKLQFDFVIPAVPETRPVAETQPFSAKATEGTPTPQAPAAGAANK